MMERHGERLVARLRHHNPSVTVTELHVESVGHENKNRIIGYLESLKLAPSVESSAGLETVVSVEVPSQSNQRDLINRILTFIRDLDIGHVSITNEPFDETQPEIETTEDSFLLVGTLSRDYTALNSQDFEELISRDKSDSEFELILSHPGRSSTECSRRLPLHQSSKDVIRSLLRVPEARDLSGCSVQRFSSRRDSSKIHSAGVQREKKLNFWTRAKNVFKRKKPQPVHTVQYFHVQTSSFIGQSINKPKPSFMSLHMEKNFRRNRILKGRSMKNNINICSFQKRLEQLSQDLLNKENHSNALSLDTWTQTKYAANGNISEDFCGQTSYTTSNNKGAMHEKSARSDLSPTSTLSEESSTASSKGRQGPSSLPRGMIRNIIPIYPTQPAYLKQPVMYSLNPVVTYNNGGRLFFRRADPLTDKAPPSRSVSRTRTTSSGRTIFSSTSPSTPTGSSTSDVTVINVNNKEEDCNLRTKSSPNHESRQLKCEIVTTSNNSPFELTKEIEQLSEDASWVEQSKKEIQTVDPEVAAADTNTSMVFPLTKITQTDKVRPSLKTGRHERCSQTSGTQTSSLLNNSTSCSELVLNSSNQRSFGIVASSDKVDRDSSCHIIPNQVSTENKEVGSENMYKINKRKVQRSGRMQKKSLGWGVQPDGRLAYGQVYAPGKVVPIMNWGPSYSTVGPFQQIYAKQQAPTKTCPRICGFFGARKRAMKEELRRQHLELLQMKTILLGINDDILLYESSTMSSSDEDYPSSYQQINSQRKVTFKDPLVE